MPARHDVRPETFTTTLPSDLLRRLRARAKAEQRTMNYYLERGIRRELGEVVE